MAHATETEERITLSVEDNISAQLAAMSREDLHGFFDVVNAEFAALMRAQFAVGGIPHRWDANAPGWRRRKGGKPVGVHTGALRRVAVESSGAWQGREPAPTRDTHHHPGPLRGSVRRPAAAARRRRRERASTVGAVARRPHRRPWRGGDRWRGRGRGRKRTETAPEPGAKHRRAAVLIPVAPAHPAADSPRSWRRHQPAEHRYRGEGKGKDRWLM